jgi:hypothetical protein
LLDPVFRYLLLLTAELINISPPSSLWCLDLDNIWAQVGKVGLFRTDFGDTYRIGRIASIDIVERYNEPAPTTVRESETRGRRLVEAERRHRIRQREAQYLCEVCTVDAEPIPARCCAGHYATLNPEDRMSGTPNNRPHLPSPENLDRLGARITTVDDNVYLLDPLVHSVTDLGGSTTHKQTTANIWGVDLERTTFAVGKNADIYMLGEDDIFILPVVRSVEWVGRENHPTREQIDEARFLSGFRNAQERQRMDVQREERRRRTEGLDT